MIENGGRGRKRPSLIDVYPSPAGHAADGLLPEPAGIETRAAERAPSGDRTSIYLPPGALRALKEIALDRDCKINDLMLEGVEAVQLGRAGPFDPAAVDAQLARQYDAIERRRAMLRASLFDLILTGLPVAEQDARSLAEAARAGRDADLAVLAAAIDQLLAHDRHPGHEATDIRGARIPSAEAVAEAFLQLLSALRERGEGEADNDGNLDQKEAGALWRTLAERLGDEYGTDRGRFARLMNGATALPTRRTLQLAFNRAESNPQVLVAQSLVGREGLNLHQACRIVILLHPEWNPGVVEQQVGRVDRVGSHWARGLEAAVQAGTRPLPRIEIRPVIFEGTYDAHHWRVLHERWEDLRAQLHGVVVPHRLRTGCTEEEHAKIRRLDAAAPGFEPPRSGGKRSGALPA